MILKITWSKLLCIKYMNSTQGGYLKSQCARHLLEGHLIYHRGMIWFRVFIIIHVDLPFRCGKMIYILLRPQQTFHIQDLLNPTCMISIQNSLITIQKLNLLLAVHQYIQLLIVLNLNIQIFVTILSLVYFMNNSNSLTPKKWILKRHTWTSKR